MRSVWAFEYCLIRRALRVRGVCVRARCVRVRRAATCVEVRARPHQVLAQRARLERQRRPRRERLVAGGGGEGRHSEDRTEERRRSERVVQRVAHAQRVHREHLATRRVRAEVNRFLSHIIRHGRKLV